MRISLGEVGASAGASEFALIRRVYCVFRILFRRSVLFSQYLLCNSDI